MKKGKLKNKIRLLILAGVMTLFNQTNVNAQDQLYGIQNNGTTYEMVVYDIVTGGETSLFNFASSFGLVGMLTYNPVDDIFYCYSEFGASDITHLLEVDACTYEITDLGAISVSGSPAYVSEGLSYDPVSNRLFGTLSTLAPTIPMTASNFHSNLLVEFTLGTANCIVQGTIAQTGTVQENEMDGIEFTRTGTNPSILFGTDGNPSPGFTTLYTVNYIASPGNSPSYYDHGAFYNLGGLAYEENADLIYSTNNGNTIITIDPSYNYAPMTNPFNNIVSLTVNPSRSVTGLAWGPDFCCAASSDPLFTTVTAPITADTYWDGKIYIPDNTIVTVDGAILDITTADVVFGDCAGIDFINGAQLRANNSVFRPCNINDTWRGLQFDRTHEEGSQLNECTFKNAEIAVHLITDEMMTLSANTFLNCNKGLYVDNAFLRQSIIGNSFILNDNYPEYTNCTGLIAPNSATAIHAVGFVSGQEDAPHITINQNHMSNSFQNSSISFYGIDMLNGEGSISENTMSNLRESVRITSPSGVVNVESNEIETNSMDNAGGPFTSQIAINVATGPLVLINNNELVNSSLMTGNTRNAIFTDRSNNINFQNNSIEGFNHGIYINRSTAVNVSENIITSALETGIYFDGTVGEKGDCFITCNDITMVMNNGAGIWTNNVSTEAQITSNCIKDAHTGLQTAGSVAIPIIRNNYIYNYETGIISNGQTGNIGTAADPGLNTLWSNNNTASDIVSVGPMLQVADNFGMSNITNVMITSNNTFHSTASCGHQIFDMPSQGNLNVGYYCDNWDQFISPFQGTQEALTLTPGVDLAGYISDNTADFVTLNKITGFTSVSEVELMQFINAAELTASEASKIRYRFYKQNGKYNQALAELDAIDATASLGNAEFIAIEKLSLKVNSGVELDADDLLELDQMITPENVNDPYYNLAVSISKSTNNQGIYNFEFKSFEPVDIDKSDIQTITDDIIKISAYPNPVKEVLTVVILDDQSVAPDSKLNVYDIFGRQIQQHTLQFVSGKITVDVSDLPAGTYFVTLTSDSEVSAKQKIIKL